ncbi:MAG TPA: hypothetical protein VN700_13140 [Vicinamibacterales bacterium]|nr:hypothetical protein [Vicinamibacterales bacterium]
MTNGSLASHRIVDLLRYKAERQQQKLDFNAAPATTPSLATITPFRPLSEDAVKHRERMMRHLSSTR